MVDREIQKRIASLLYSVIIGSLHNTPNSKEINDKPFVRMVKYYLY